MLDDSVRDDKEKGREQTFAEPEVEDVADVACPTCQGTRLNATARAVKFDRCRHHRDRAPERERRARLGRDP